MRIAAVKISLNEHYYMQNITSFSTNHNAWLCMKKLKAWLGS